MAFHLPSVLKALLFSSGQPLSVKDIQDVFARFHEQRHAPAESETTGEQSSSDESAEADETTAPAGEIPNLVTAAEIRDAMEAVSQELEQNGDVYLLDESAKGYRIVTNPQFAPWVRALRNEPPPARLTVSSLETLAVVAYRQPVTRSEIEAVRGVSADAGLNKLLERELIYITGRAELPGRPLQYSTTDKFLEFVGVKSLVELPASDVLSPRQIDEWLKDAMNPIAPGDAEMGLPLEAGEGESPMEDEAHIENADGTDHLEAPTESNDSPDGELPADTGVPAVAVEESVSEETPIESAPEESPDTSTEEAPAESPPESEETEPKQS
ncbi:SMC-Scp complex subunit ScpB [Opitutaceae bacterium]|nr:SMC-Scp complex subunit ScpB [Opitutaceae bacterium]